MTLRARILVSIGGRRARMRVAHRAALFALALLGHVLGASPARAQDPPPLPTPDSMLTMICKKVCDVVSGIAHDSLADAPLGGAFVVAMPSGVSTTADSLGRFLIASDGLVEQLTVYHEVLDELGLGALTAKRPANAKEWKRFRVATPSLPTIWPRLCSTPAPSRLRGVVIAGTVKFADNSTRVAGAKVLAQWANPPHAAGEGEFATAEAFSDSTGGFVICGVADFVEPSIAALATESQSGVVTLPADTRPLRRIDLVMARNGAAHTIFRGRIVNEWNAPLPNVRVSVDGRDGEVVTDVDGIFRLVDTPLGSRMLSVRALNYPPGMQVVHVLEGDVEPITVPITRTYTLGRINLSPTDTVRRERVEFERRKRTGIGFFIDSLALQNARDLRSALKLAPGISIIEAPMRSTVQSNNETRATLMDGAPTSSRAEFIVRGSGSCALHVFLDGELDRENTALFTSKDQFAAIEVYTRASDLRSYGSYSSGVRSTGLPNLRCGALMFWTRYGLRP